MKMHLLNLKAACSAMLICALCALPAAAQFRAGVQGVVTDPAGANVPGAMVTLTSLETTVAHAATTGNDGTFTFTGLAPGGYSLAVEKAGFSKKVFAQVNVAAEQMQSLNVELSVGEITQSVTVEAPAVPLIDTQTAMVGGTVTAKQIEDLPSFSRDPFQLIRLAPGVFGDGALSNGGGAAGLPGFNVGGPSATDSIFKVENGVQVSANGGRQNSNNFQVDGVGVNSTSWGGAAVITPNEESVKEIRIVANNYSAENGRNSGAQVMVVSANGTNDLHGSAFFKFHRPGLNAYQSWNGPGSPSPVSKDTNRFNQFGGSLGGPIIRNKLFAFFSYETLRNNSWSVSTGWYQTPQYLSTAGGTGTIARQLLAYPGTSPSFTNIITETCAQVGLPGTQCKDVTGGLDLGSPLKTAKGTTDPTFGAAGTPYGIGGGLDGVADAYFLQTTSPNNNTSVQYNGRLDYDPTNKDMVAFSIYWVPLSSSFYNGPARAMDLFHHESLANSMTGIYTRTISSTMINEARFGLSGWNWNEINSNPQVPWGLPTANFLGMGSISLQNFGAPGYSIFNQKTYVMRDTLSKVKGSQSLKFGGDYSKSQFLDSAPWAARPNYDFRNLWEFANDTPYHEGSNFDPLTGKPTAVEKNLRFNVLAFFAQDDWKVKPNLTVNLGLRWEYFSPLTETQGNLSNVILGTGSSVLTGLKIRKGGDLFSTSKGNFGPQLGVAWSPHSLMGRDMRNRLVLRGGFGIGYNLQQLAITSNGRFNPPFVVSLDLYGSNILYAPSSSVSSYAGWPSNPAAVQSFNSNGLPTSGAPVSLTGFPDTMPSTVTYRYSFDAQYDLGRNWMASLGYQGNQSRHSTIQTNWNLLYNAGLNPMVQSVGWYANEANSHSNALLAQVQHRFSQSFDIDFQYQLRKTMDQGSQDYFMDMYPWNLSHAYGPADYDATHSVKLWGAWTPKVSIGGGNNWASRMAGGWTISGIISAHTGFPFTPQYCNTGGNVAYPGSGFWCLYPSNYTGGAGTSYSNSTFMAANGNFPKGALAYLTVPTFPALGAPPNPSSSITRNMFRGPGYLGNDFQLGKNFALPRIKGLGEGAKLKLQANFYNLFNKLNLNNINNTISNDGVTSNPQFGQAQGALAGRIVELQMRFSF